MIKTEVKNVWEWLHEQGYCYSVDRGGWESPCGFFFFSDRITYLKPGEIIYFLRNGNVRDASIMLRRIK